MGHLRMQPVKINSKLLRDRLCIPEILGARRHFIRDAFLAGLDAYHRLIDTAEVDSRQKHKSDARTALRTIVIHGLDYSLQYFRMLRN